MSKTKYEDLPEDVQVHLATVYGKITCGICAIREPQEFKEGVAEKVLVEAIHILGEMLQ